MPRSSASAPEFAGRPPWTQPGFLAAAALVAALVGAGVVVALLPGDDNPGGTSVLPPSAPAQSVIASAPPAGPQPTSVPTVAPDGVTWQLVRDAAVPVSSSAGPRLIAGGTAKGYAHTPIGALIAAAQISIRAGFSSGRESWEPTVKQQFVPGADRDRLLTALYSAGDSPSEPGERSRIIGFIYQSYTPDTAVIGLVYRAPSAGSPRYHVVTVTLLWRNGDWRMVAPPGGAWTSVNRPAADLTGVVEWGPR